MGTSAVNALNVHPSGFFSDNSCPNGAHIARQQGGAQNLISDNSMTYYGGNETLTESIETFNKMLGGDTQKGGGGYQYRGGNSQELEAVAKQISAQIGGMYVDAQGESTALDISHAQSGGETLNDASFGVEQLSGMNDAIVQMGGKVKKDQSISQAFFTLLRNRKYLAIQRKNQLAKGFKTLLATRKKIFKKRKEALDKTFSGMRGRSPAERMVGREMKQTEDSRRITLKHNIAKSIARSVGRSVGKSIKQAGGRRSSKCLRSCKKKHRHHRHTSIKKRMKGGAGYAIAGINISPSDSALAQGLFSRYNDCPVGGTYQHPVV